MGYQGWTGHFHVCGKRHCVFHSISVIKEFVMNGVSWGIGFDGIRYSNDSMVRGWINLVGNMAVESSSVMKYKV